VFKTAGTCRKAASAFLIKAPEIAEIATITYKVTTILEVVMAII
jgi:hypothetical protein